MGRACHAVHVALRQCRDQLLDTGHVVLHFGQHKMPLLVIEVYRFTVVQPRARHRECSEKQDRCQCRATGRAGIFLVRL
jgi:hypothetical protein